MKYLYLILIFLFASYQVHASHVMGSEIHYRSIGNGQYEITLKVYRDCNGIQLSQSNIVARCSSNIVNITSQTKISVRDVTGVSPNCPTGSRCSGSTYPYGVEEHVWKATVDLSSYSCCEWTLSWEQCCRNGAITTGQSGENFFVTAQLNKCIGSNASPTFETLPIRMLCYNKNVTYNLGLQDTVDVGDSFSFALVPALTGLNSSATYSAQYSATNPLKYFGFPNANLSYPAGFHLNPVSGDLSFRPVQINEISVIVIEVSEWRKNANQVWELIGKTRRDMQIIIVNCSASSTAPRLAGPYSYEICAGDSVNIPFYTSDLNSADSTKIYSVFGSLPGAKFTNNNGTVRNAVGILHWRTDSSMVSNQPYNVTIRVEDNGCPLASEISLTIRIFVRDSTQTASFFAGPDRTMGREDTIALFGLDTFNVGQQAYWKSLGDGYFSDSLAVLSTYHLGQTDRNNCDITVLRIPLTSSSCRSMDPDTMIIRRWQGGLSIEEDSSVHTADSVGIRGIIDLDSSYTFWWSTAGDGTFTDSSTFITVYLFGAQDSVNCGAWIYLNSNSPASCSETKDSAWVTIGNDHVPINLTYSLSSVSGDSIFLSLSVGTNQPVNWYSAGAGSWIVDSLNHTAIYLPSLAEKAAGTATLWATQDIYCDPNVDSDTVTVNFSPSSTRLAFEISMHLYPNPTEGILYLESTHLDQVSTSTIYDIHGKEISLTPHVQADKYSWDLTGLNQGMYLLLITDLQGNKLPLRFIVR